MAEVTWKDDFLSGAEQRTLLQRQLTMGARHLVGCSVLGRGAEPLVRTQSLEHPPTLNFGANHLKKWIQHPQKPPIPFLCSHNLHCRGGFFRGGVKELEHS